MNRGAAKIAGGKKSGGLPSSRASDAAERSPAVYFANLKADMLLQKQRQVLKRAENSLVHRIVIDQKILFRRFQAKLRRSKLARARLWGDKEAERQLRGRDLHVLNTNCGQTQDHLAFLKKLHTRPCTWHLPAQGRIQPPAASSSTPEVTDRDMEDLIRAVLEDQEPPHTEKTLQSLSTLSHLLEEVTAPSSARSEAKQGGKWKPAPKVTIRPVTTPARTQNLEEKPARDEVVTVRKGQATDREDVTREATPRKKKSKLKKSQKKEDPQPPRTDPNRPRPLTSPVRSHSQTKAKKASLKTPHPASAASRTKSAQSSLTVGTCSPLQASRRPSQAASSMFEEQKKVDMVAVRLAEARSVDYAPRVFAFIQTLLDLDKKERARPATSAEPGEVPVGPEEASSANPQPDSEREEENEEGKEELKGDRKFDYYATKMALYAASVKKAPPARLPGTPEEINMRLVGDQSIKSITMPPLRLYRDEGEEEEGGGDCDVYQDYGSTNILTLHHEA